MYPKSLSFLLILLNNCLFILVNSRLFLNFGEAYVYQYSSSAIQAIFVFSIGMIVYFRTKDLSWVTFFFLVFNFSLAWRLEFHTLFPQDPFAFLLIQINGLFLPLSFFFFYYLFTHQKNKSPLWVCSLVILIFHLLVGNHQSFDYVMLLSIIMLSLFFFCSSFRQLPYKHSYHLTLLISFSLIFIFYLFLQNSFRFFDLPKWMFVLIFHYQLPNVFLIFFPIILSYILIKENEFSFLLNLTDFFFQIFFIVLLTSLAIYFFTHIFAIPLTTLSILILIVLTIFFVAVSLEQFILTKSYKNLFNRSQIDKMHWNLLEEKTLYDDYTQALGNIICDFIMLETNQISGVSLIWKRNKQGILFQTKGSLINLKLTKKLKHQLLSSQEHIYMNDKMINKVTLTIYTKNIGWLLLDSNMPLTQDHSLLLKKILNLLSLSIKLDSKNSRLIPEYFSIYTEYLKDLTFTQQSEQLRKELSYYLHDDILQTILALKNMSELALQNPENSEFVLKTVQQELTDLNQSIRNKMFDLYPSTLMDLPFNQSVYLLVEQAKNIHRNSTIKINIQIDTELNVPAKLRYIIYRMIKELLNNALKHSQATTIGISMTDTEDSLIIIVMDDGIGIRLQHHDSIEGVGVGLLGIFQEVESLSGYFQISSNKPTGSIMKIHLPKKESL